MTLQFARQLALAALEAKAVGRYPSQEAAYDEAVALLKADFEGRPIAKPAPQAQDSVTDQLRRGIPLLDNAGLYDAADYVRRVVGIYQFAGIDKSR